MAVYRRIELIHHYPDSDPWEYGEYYPTDIKLGIMGVTHYKIVDAWMPENSQGLRGPKHGVPRNARFYFTEKGWKVLGRNVVAACKEVGQDYRVIAIKETDAQVVWRDKFTGYEVAVQPKRKRKNQ